MLRYSFSPNSNMQTADLEVALINYIVSIQTKEGFIIRVEDIDKEQNSEDKEQEFLDVLKKFSIKEELLIHQSENLKIYQELAYRLLKEKKAFACFCNNDTCIAKCHTLQYKDLQELKGTKTPFVLRLKKPIEAINFKDIIQGDFTVEPEEVGDIKILNADGKPTITFATAVDDMITAISKVIRKKSHISETAKEIYIQKELGFNEAIEYAHLPNIIFSDSNKSSFKWLLKQGFLPDAIINFLLTIFSESSKDILYLSNAVEQFDILKVQKDDVIFNLDKLKEINREHLKAMDSKKLSSIFGFADKDIGELLKLYLNEASTINELEPKFKVIFEPKDCAKCNKEIIEKLASIIAKSPMIENFEEFKKYLIKESNLTQEQIIKPIRILLTNKEQGPELNSVYSLIKSYILEVARCR